MKRFYLFILIVTVFFSLLLHFSLSYSLIVVFYHIVVLAVLHLCVLVFNLLVFLILRLPYRRLAFHAFNFLFLFSYIQFYIFVLSSNAFWKKTITIPIIKNYINSFQNFISILPVQAWMILTLIAADISICVMLYLLLSKKLEISYSKFTQKIKNGNSRRLASMASLLIALIFLFNDKLIALKRKIHFAEEPTLQFVFGSMWGEQNTLAFDKQRYLNGIKDQECINSINNIPKDNRNIIIILVDGLRPDHLPQYGYKRNTAPFLDSLYKTKNLHLIRNAFSTSTNTIGGISGLFFSKDWNEFGFNGLSLMKFLKKSGYTTYALLTGFHRDWYGLSALYRGSCDYYYESSTSPKVQSDDDLVTLKVFENLNIKKNSFVYIHLLSTHVIGKKNDSFRKFQPDKISLNTSKKTALTNNYDNGILQADFIIKEIFHKLSKDNTLSKSTIFILSDHGELFGESNTWGHGGNIHQKLISIPILVYDQDMNWYKNNEAATLKDIAPTIVDRLGFKIPTCWEGRSLHEGFENSQVEVNSVEECDYPSGTLVIQDSNYVLKIQGPKKEVKKIIEKKEDTWILTYKN